MRHRLLLAILVCLGLLVAPAVRAQAPAPPKPPAPTPAPAAAPAVPTGLPGAALAARPAPADPAAQRAQVEALIRTLQDDQARAQLIDQLQGLTAAQPLPPPTPLAPLLERLQDAAAERAQVVWTSMLDVAASVGTFPEFAGWLVRQLNDEVIRVIWRTVLTQIGLAFLLGIAASFAVRFLLRGWQARRTQLPPSPPLRAKLVVAGARLFVDLAGLGAFVGVGYLALQLLNVTYLARVVAVDLLTAATLARTITATSRALLATRQPRARLLPLTDGQARAARRWISWISGLAIYGYAYLSAALALGLPWTVHGFLQHLLYLVVIVLVVIAIFRSRRFVAALIRSLGEGRRGWMRRVLPWETLAVAGHYVLALWVVLQYLVWALRLPEGTALLTRGTIVTIVGLVALRAFSIGLDRLLLGPARATTGEAAEEHDPAPVPAARSLAVAGLRAVAAVIVAAVILEAWGFSVSGWLASPIGRDLVERFVNLVSVSAVAGLAWYAVDRSAQRYMSARDAEGNPVHNNRTRTLANIVRNLALTVALFVVVGQLLSELGVNTAAILAGAGVVGFAIGFGSQKLVQDLTTGLFILLGDTVRVGDVVRLGDRSGVVEAVSMRTVTLRDYNGEVHTIPYSSISIVTNMTKDYAFAVFNLVVGYGEDPDRVIEVLREIDSQMRREWPYRRIMLEPLDVAGVDAFTERGVVIMARSRTRAGEQWKVSREFNRRLKKRFDELGIRFPMPQQAVYVADDQREPSRPPRPRPEIVRAEVRGSEG